MCLQLKARCEELKLDWSTLSLENLLKEKQALKNQISEKQKHCLELQVEWSEVLEPPALNSIQPVFQLGVHLSCKLLNLFLPNKILECRPAGYMAGLINETVIRK